MSDKHETHAAVIAEMRECEGYRAYYDGGKHHDSYEESVVGVDYLRDFTDRLEAAHKRELAEAEARGLDAGGIVEAAHRCKLLTKSPENVNSGAASDSRDNSGDAAKLREAIDKCVNLITEFGNAEIVKTPLDVIIDIEAILKAALAAPPRNCDRFATWAEADQHLFETKCQNCGDHDYTCEDCKCEWLFAPATERKGEGDGN